LSQLRTTQTSIEWELKLPQNPTHPIVDPEKAPLLAQNWPLSKPR
jgi:hypothetical protein